MIEELRPQDPRQVGPYRLTGRLGGGGMGEVYLGRSAGGRAVAVKVIRAELAADPEFRYRFRREVAAARSVNGLYTALVADADADAPMPWLATAYVPGPSLSGAVRDHGPLPERSVLALAGGLAEGLGAIHAAGLVHRDLKPSNVLLADDGPRVIDFGISWAVGSTVLTSAGWVVGSPGFMSPEQAAGRPVGPPTDVFSLGAVLTFAATGVGPFGTGATPALLYRIVHGEPDLERVPDRVRQLVRRCLAKNPAERPTADDLLAELGDVQLWAEWLPESLLAEIRGSRAGAGRRRAGVGGPRVRGAAGVAAGVAAGRPPEVPRPETTQTVETPPGGKSTDRAAPVAPAQSTNGMPPVGQGPDQDTSPASPASPPASPAPAAGRRPVSRRGVAVLAAAVLAVAGVAAGLALALPRGTGGSPGTKTTTSPAATPTPTYPPFAAAGVSRHACSGTYTSGTGRDEVRLVVTNSSGAVVKVIWLKSAARQELYVTLKPGQSRTLDVYVGDYWRIASSGGGCLGIFSVSSRDGGHITAERT